MGMMNMGGGRGTIGMPVPQGARWLGQPAGPRPAQVNEQMQPQAPMQSQLPAALPSQMAMPSQPVLQPQQAMNNAWAQQPPMQRGIGDQQLRNPLARLLAGR